jgi:pimeloyl-ACP methyl ester carboxylesterase
MKNIINTVLVAYLLTGAAAEASDQNAIRDFDVTPFKNYTQLQPGVMKEQSIQTDAGTVSILRSSEISQELPSVVFIHNNSGCKEGFIKLFDHIHSKCNIVSIDLPGHGKSDNAANPDQDYSFQGYARAVLQVADALTLKHFTPVGWSLGGHAAMELMGIAPDRIKGVVTTGSPAMTLRFYAPLQAFNVFRMWWKGVMPMLGQQTQFSEQEAKFFMESGGMNPADDFFVQAAMRTDSNARAKMMKNNQNGVGVVDQHALLEISDIPIGIVIGVNDQGVNADYIRNSSRTYKNATILELNTDHGTVWNEPKAFSNFLLEFLRNNWNN